MLRIKTRLLTLLLVIIGSGLLYTGSSNILEIYQLLNSSLDQGFSAGGGDPFLSQYRPPSADQASDLFLPIYAASSEESSALAPEIELSQNEVLEQPGTEIRVEVPVLVPERLVIENLGIDSQIIPVEVSEVEYLGEVYKQWRAPRDNQLGWHSSSAKIGAPGNTVINGHSSGFGESFKELDQLKNGDIIHVYAENYRYSYLVANTLIMKERWESIEVRMQNAVWINPSEDERITLVSCWPNNSSTHRLIVVAIPLEEERLETAVSIDN